MRRSLVRKSIVWDHFEIMPDKKSVVCNTCKKQYKYFGNTTNLKEHLKRVHPLKLIQEDDIPTASCSGSQTQATPSSSGSQQPTPSSSGSRTQPTPSSCTQAENTDHNYFKTETPTPSKRKRQLKLTASTTTTKITDEYIQEIDKSIVKLIATDYQPFTIVEDEGFKELVFKLNPNYKLPSRKTLSNILLPKYYNEILIEITEKMQSVEYVSITSDYWSSNTQKAYISVTAHFIENFQLHSATLAAREVTTSHNSENTGAVLKNILNEFSIFEKVVTIVTDNAANMKKAVTDELKKYHHPCVAHTVNLSVNDAINSSPDFLSILTKCRTLIAHFKHSIISYNKLRQKQEEMGLKALSLKQDVSTRWNSTYMMLQRLLDLKQPISITLPELTSSSTPENLSGSEWAVLADCVPVLRPLLKITEELSAEKYITMSKIVPLIRGLQHNLRMVNPSTDVGEQLKKALLDFIQRRLGFLESTKIVAKATFLDPRFKKTGFGLESNAKMAQEWVVEELARLISSETLPETAEVSVSRIDELDQDDLWSHFDQKAASDTSYAEPTSSAIIMVKQYNERKLLPRKDDPLKYWSDHSTIFPQLSVLAKKYLSIPATSVPSERLFSKSGYILNDRRSRLSSQRLNEILFLNANM